MGRRNIMLQSASPKTRKDLARFCSCQCGIVTGEASKTLRRSSLWLRKQDRDALAALLANTRGASHPVGTMTGRSFAGSLQPPKARNTQQTFTSDNS